MQAVQIGCELEDLQKAVGGDIEATYPFNEPVALLMHEEGKLAGKDLNLSLIHIYTLQYHKEQMGE